MLTTKFDQETLEQLVEVVIELFLRLNKSTRSSERLNDSDEVLIYVWHLCEKFLNHTVILQEQFQFRNPLQTWIPCQP